MTLDADPEKHRGRLSTAQLISVACFFAGSFMQMLDTTIVNVTLPFIQGGLQASRDQITWVLTSYIIGSALMTAPIAWLTSRMGRKTLFQICISAFTVASVFCGASQSIESLVAFRLLQGAAAAALTPVAMSIFVDTFEDRIRNRMIGYFSMAGMFGAVIGPTVGGYITDAIDWRWSFYLNVPVGIAIFLGVAVFFRDTTRDTGRRSFDAFGFATFAVGLGAFQLVLDRGAMKDWFGSSEIIIESAVACIAFYLFATHMATDRRCFLPPALFRDKNYNLGTVIGTVNFALTLASAALLPIYLQTLGNHSVLATGLLLSPRGIGAMIGTLAALRMLYVVDLRLIIGLGLALGTWSFWMIARWTPDVSEAEIVWISLAQGFAFTLASAATNILSFTTIPVALTTEASMVYMLARTAGPAFLISLSSTVLARNAQGMHETIASAATPFNRALSFDAPSFWWNTQIPSGLEALNEAVTRSAEVIAYSNVYMMLVYVSIGTILGVLLIGKISVSAAAKGPVIHE